MYIINLFYEGVMSTGVLWGLKLGAGVSLVVMVPLFFSATYREYSPQQQSLETAGVRVSGKVVKKEVKKVFGTPKGGLGAAASATRVTSVFSSMEAGARLGRAMNRAKGAPLDPRDTVDEYWMRYAFQTPTGQTFEGNQILPESKNQWLTVGSNVRVVYLPADPNINRAVDYSTPFVSSSKPKSFIIGFLAVLAGGFLLRSAWREWSGYEPAAKKVKTNPLDGRLARVARPGRAHA